MGTLHLTGAERIPGILECVVVDSIVEPTEVLDKASDAIKASMLQFHVVARHGQRGFLLRGSSSPAASLRVRR